MDRVEMKERFFTATFTRPALLVILNKASIASAVKDLGQLRASEAGTGIEIAKRSFVDVVAQASEFSVDAATQNRNWRHLRAAVRGPSIRLRCSLRLDDTRKLVRGCCERCVQT
ncbi:MAG TPA: hypothetical protein VJX68_11335 [Candidatus Binatus sp.]|uniref:hypothetical protein n=1 Tax=Candidatus Binatus sp. TaxID=2811406 RepID=UPI002B49BDE6|nr:hypothetical protein [Candidatus Binatus sp.]HKN13776.1 hypothetical protein [Candidatus Binatus sp.]